MMISLGSMRRENEDGKWDPRKSHLTAETGMQGPAIRWRVFALRCRYRRFAAARRIARRVWDVLGEGFRHGLKLVALAVGPLP